MNTVEEKIKAVTKHDVKGVKAERKTYAKLLYPPIADFKWSIKNNQIKNYGVSVRSIDTTQEIWVNYISALKINAVQGKPIVIASDCMKIPKEIANLKKTVFLTAEILFVNRIPFFIPLSRNIDFT